MKNSNILKKMIMNFSHMMNQRLAREQFYAGEDVA